MLRKKHLSFFVYGDVRTFLSIAKEKSRNAYARFLFNARGHTLPLALPHADLGVSAPQLPSTRYIAEEDDGVPRVDFCGDNLV